MCMKKVSIVRPLSATRLLRGEHILQTSVNWLLMSQGGGRKQQWEVNFQYVTETQTPVT